MTSPIYTQATIGRVKTMLDTGLTNKEIAAAIGTTEARLAVRISQLGLSRYPRRAIDDGHTRVARATLAGRDLHPLKNCAFPRHTTSSPL